MNLLNSIFTSLFIVAMFFSLAFFQSNIAFALSGKQINQSLPESFKVDKSLTDIKIKHSKKQETLHIAGVKQQITLSDMSQLWDKFNLKNELHKSLKHAPNKVYVLYSAFTKNYQQAEVTIGYDVNELAKPDQHYSINTSQYTALLPAQKYSEVELTNAWGKINYSKKVDYVLEVHDLDKYGSTTSTQMFVSYK